MQQQGFIQALWGGGTSEIPDPKFQKSVWLLTQVLQLFRTKYCKTAVITMYAITSNTCTLYDL